MRPKLLEPSTLEPLTPAAAPAAKTGMGEKAACPTTWDMEALFESENWYIQFTAKAALPATKLSRTAFSSEEIELGLLRPSSRVCFIQVSTWTPLSLLKAGA